MTESSGVLTFPETGINIINCITRGSTNKAFNFGWY